MNPLIQLKKATPVFFVALICFGLLPTMQAVSPAPDGGYPGGNTAEGQSALLSLTSGIYNTAVGWLSLMALTDGKFNTAIGAGTLYTNTADGNTGVGAGALLNNTSGNQNTATGALALFANTTGFGNTATGSQTLFNNTTSTLNTADGAVALFSNTTGSANTALGQNVMYNNTTGNDNTATGVSALANNVAGSNNTANGSSALASNTLGQNNTATGIEALVLNTTGNFNTAVGNLALEQNTTGSENTALGDQAGFNDTEGSGNVYIGAGVLGLAGEAEDNHTYIRNINTTSLGGPGTDTVIVNLTTGLLGHASSSRRYKEDIKPMDKTSEALFALKPVTYRYKKEIDPNESPAFGLIAEEVAEVNPNLVARNSQGQPESVHYEAVNAMLLNEFLKEHRHVQEQQNEIDVLRAELKEQRALIQKVNDKVELAKPVPQTVLNNQ